MINPDLQFGPLHIEFTARGFRAEAFHLSANARRDNPSKVPFTSRHGHRYHAAMKTYILTRDRSHACTLHVMGEKFRVPMLFASDQYPAWPMLTVAVTLLLEYFDGDQQAEFKAQLMSRALVRFLSRLGEEWALTEDQLDEAVMTILISGQTAIVDAANDICLEYLGGSPRPRPPQSANAGN